MRRVVTALLIGAAVLSAAGCDVLFPQPSADDSILSDAVRGYALRCGPLPRDECERRAAAMVVRARMRVPDVPVLLVEFTSDGDSRVRFANGTEILAIVN